MLMNPRFTLLLNEVIFMHQLWMKSSRLILSQAVDVKYIVPVFPS